MSGEPRPPTAAKVFFSYSHRDEELRDKLARHLSALQRQGLIAQWHDRRISAGEEWQGAIDINLQEADIILLLISADFIASDYCYGVEVEQAMERHEAGFARVVPVLLRPTDCEGTPFSKLQALPKDAKPITVWSNLDEALFDVAQGLRRVIEGLNLDKMRSSDRIPCNLTQSSVEEISPAELGSAETSLKPEAPPQIQQPMPSSITLGQPQIAPFNMRQLVRHMKQVSCIAFSPDGSILASASGGSHILFAGDCSVRLWSVSDGSHLRTFEGHIDQPHSLAFSPDGAILYSASYPAVWLWRVSDGTRLTSFEKLETACIALSPDGSTLASVSVPWLPDDDRQTVKLWRTPDGERLGTLEASEPISSVVFSPDGSTLAAKSGRTVRLWRVSDGVILRTIKVSDEQWVTSLAFASDGATLALGAIDVWVWRVSDGELLHRLKGDSKGQIYSVAFSPDGAVVAAGSDDKTVWLWRLSGGEFLRTLEGHKKRVNCVAFSPDGAIVASGSDDKTVRLWDFKMILKEGRQK